MKRNATDPKSEEKKSPVCGHTGSRTAAVFFGIVTLILAAWLGITLWMPRASENALSAAARRLSVPGTIEFSVLSVSPRSARLACAMPDNSFSCDDIQIRYSPWHVRSGEVDKIVLKHAQITPSALRIFDQWFASKLHADPGFTATRIEFDDCTFTPGGDAAPFTFSGKVVPDSVDQWRILRGNLKSSDDGKTPNLNIEYRAVKRILKLSGTVRNFMTIPLYRTAVRTLTSDASDDAIRLFDISLNFRDLALDLTGTDPKSCIQQAEFDFSAVCGDVRMTDGHCSFDSEKLAGKFSFIEGKNQPLSLQFTVSGPWFGNWMLESLPQNASEPVRWIRGKDQFSSPKIVLKGGCFEGSAVFIVTTSFFCEKMVSGPVAAGSMSLESAKSAKQTVITRTFKDFAWNDASFFMHAPAVTTMSCQTDDKKTETFKMEKGHLEFPALKLQFGNMDVGQTCSIGSVRMNGTELGTISGKCSSGDELKTFAISGAAKLLGQDGSISAVFRTEKPDQSEVTLKFPAQKIAGNGKQLLHFFVPVLETGTLNGTAEFQFIYTPGKKTCIFSLAGGTFDLPDAAVSAKGLSLKLTFPDYEKEKYATVPACPFTFDSLSIGGLTLGKGAGSFRIGPDGIIRLETASAEWCGGKIVLSPVDIASGRSGGTVDCIDIDFAKMLTQLGLGNFAGSGKVSGKIPFTLTDGLILQNGQLYSVPGADGVLKGELLETVMSGKDISDDRLSFACEMIRDMQYRWVKASINSGKSGGITLALSFNGSPRRELFYEPDLKNGGIRKSSRSMKLGYLLLNLDEVNLQTDALNKTVNFFLKVR